MPTRIILIRHGQTDWSSQKRYNGITDVSLNEEGKSQARRLCERLKSEKIHKVYSSDMKRTLQFAAIALKDMSIEKLFQLREMNFGVFEGLTYGEIMNKYPDIYKQWLRNPLKTVIRGTESLDSLAERVRNALAQVLSLNKNLTVAVFTHAGPIKVILCDALKLGLEKIWQIEQDLAGLSIIEFDKGNCKVCLLNDTSYLNG
jgi:alpha-ribazole phosphatase